MFQGVIHVKILQGKKYLNIYPFFPCRFPEKTMGQMAHIGYQQRKRDSVYRHLKKDWNYVLLSPMGCHSQKVQKVTLYKVQNIWQFILVITSYFSMIKFSLKKKKKLSFLRTSVKIRLEIYTHVTRALDPDFLKLFCSI